MQKVVSLIFDKSEFSEPLENIIVEFELMNPIENYSTFSVFFNFND